jgi:hypothetical protein
VGERRSLVLAAAERAPLGAAGSAVQGVFMGDVEEFESENDWGSDLRTFHDRQLDGPVESNVFRFSPVADNREVLERFLTTARRHGLVVYARASRCILQPRIEIVERDLKQSMASRFISDPYAAISEAAANVEMPKLKKSKLD